jgi:CBS domain-containing protein
MLFLSKLVGRPVRDRDGDAFGKVRDLIVALGERYPPVTGLVVRVAGDRDIFLPWSDVEEITADGARLRTTLIDMATFRQRPNEIRLWLDLLDKQIVDVRTEDRAGQDIQLAPVEGRLRLRGGGRGAGRDPAPARPLRAGERWSRALHLEVGEHRVGGRRPGRVSPPQLRVPHRRSAPSIRQAWRIVEQLAPGTEQGSWPPSTTSARRRARGLAADDQVDILEALEPEKAADILEEMGPDEAADLVADLSEERQEQLLGLMEPEEASDVRELLAYGEETAGGLMTTDFITVTPEMTAEGVIERLRELHPDADQVYYLYVTDAEGLLVGTITLRGLIVASRDTLKESKQRHLE